MYLLRYYILCELHHLVLHMSGDYLSPIAYSIPGEMLFTVKPNS
jgi:hypothetical protein